jgi:glycosyltransferase 2 family protein
VPNRRPPWAFLAGIVVTVGLLWWVLHDIDWAAALSHVRQANFPLLIAMIVVATAPFPLRLPRWRLMLRGADGKPLPLLPLWQAIAVGFMANNLLLARAGEVARAWVAGRTANVRVSTALASIVLERVFDAFAILGLMTVALVSPSFPRDAQMLGVDVQRLAFTVGAGFAVFLLLCVIVVLRPEPWLKFLRAIASRILPARFGDKVIGVARGLVEGLGVLRTPGRVAGVAFWSIVIWVVYATSFWLGFRALNLDLPFEAAFLLVGLIAIGVAIPAAPGFFGVFEAVAVVALGFYGVPKEHAVSFAIVYHLTTFVPITLLGLHALAQLGVRLRDLRAAPAS